MNTEKFIRGIALLFFNLGVILGWVVNTTFRLLYPREKEAVPILQKAGWSQGRSGGVQKISPPPEFNSQTVQPVASRYTVYIMECTCRK